MYKIFKAVSKNTVITVVLVLMICLAAYLNYVYEGNSKSKEAINNSVKTDQTKDSTAKEVDKDKKDKNGGKTAMASLNYFAEQKMDREKTRSKEIDYLNNTIRDKSLSDTDKAEARKQYVRLVGFIEREANIERILKAKGFKNVLVWLGGKDDNDLSANVIVKIDNLTTQKQVQIEDAVMGETHISDYDKIKITPINN